MKILEIKAFEWKAMILTILCRKNVDQMQQSMSYGSLYDDQESELHSSETNIKIDADLFLLVLLKKFILFQVW